MSEQSNYRMERIDRLLKELRYEVERGMMDGEIDETLGFTFYVPRSKTFDGGIVKCEFRTRPHHRFDFDPLSMESTPRLRVIDGGRPR